jgi:hypothetical protein
MPAIPDSWKAAWEFLQLYPRILSGIDGGGERGGDNWNEQIPGPTLPNWNELSKQQMASRKGGGRSDDDEDDVDPNVWIERFRKQSNARARERGKAVSRPKVGVKRDPRDFCSDRCEEEKKRCGERYPDYAHNHFLWGCETRAEERRNMCTANGGEPRPDELAEWDLDDEELFRNLYR